MPTPIDPNTLAPGRTFTQGLYTRRGVMLVAPNSPLTPEICHACSERAVAIIDGEPTWNLYLAGSHHDIHQAIARDELATGLDPFDTTQPKDPALHQRERRRAASTIIDSLLKTWTAIPLTHTTNTTPLAEDDQPPEDPARWPAHQRLATFRNTRIEAIEQIHKRIADGAEVRAAETHAIADELVTLWLRFPARFPQLADHALADHTLADHSLANHSPSDHTPNQPNTNDPANTDESHTRRIATHAWTAAVHAVALTAHAKWDAHDVAAAAQAAILADVGMTLLPPRTTDPPRQLNEIELNRLWRHPGYSVSMLETVPDLPENIRRAVYQHHERNDGSGYPARLHDNEIAQLARYLAVADVYAAATAPRPHRPAKHPHAALRELVHHAANNRYDRHAVRALTNALGIFPVGAGVRLSTGEHARVIANNKHALDRPVVRTTRHANHKSTPGPIIDLAEFLPWQLHILGPTDDPAKTWSRPRHAC